MPKIETTTPTTPAMPITTTHDEPSRCVIIGSKVALEYDSFFNATRCPTTIVACNPLLRTKTTHHVDEDARRYVLDSSP